MTAAIRTTKLSKHFPGGHGVEALDLHVPSGSIYGFLGPNGAGKTTTIRLLLSLLRPDSGTISILGRPLRADDRSALANVGALVDNPSLYPHLTGRDNLEVTRRLIGAPKVRIDDVLARVELRDAADRRVRDYSLGMRQRLALALALLGGPRILILDEPTNGLDPSGIQDFRALLRSLVSEQGLTVFLSSHLLSEMEQVASHIGVLQAGTLLFEGPLELLRQRVPPRLLVRCDPPALAHAELERWGENAALHADQSLVVELGGRSSAEINRLLVERGIAVAHLALENASLESLFLDLTGRPGLAS